MEYGNQDVNQGQNLEQPTAVQEAVSREDRPSEKTFRQADVDQIVKRAKQDAIDSYRRQQQEQPEYIQRKYGNEAPASGVSQEEIRKLAAEEANRLRDEWLKESAARYQEEEAKRIVSDFTNKIEMGKSKYSDFDDVIGDIEYQHFPNIVQLVARDIENADDVLYELGRNRTKMAALEMLAERSPKDALKDMKRLAQSIKDNREAEKARSPREPLNQLRPSSVGVDSGGILSFKDLRAKYRG